MTDPDEMKRVTVDLDSFSPESQQGLREEIARRSPVPMFDGTMEHSYTKAWAGHTDRCPRCGAATVRKTANFVYATDTAPRAMLAPAGYFCGACPTVIIDEDFIAGAVKPGVTFRRVVAIDDDNGKRLDIFKTWNGKKPVYVLDENEQFAGLETIDPTPRLPAPPTSRSRDRKKEKRKKKLAEKARRRNRR